MSEHPVTLGFGDLVTEGPGGLRDEVTRTVRPPTQIVFDGTRVLYRFTPDLVPAEVASFNAAVSACRSRNVVITATEWAALDPHLVTLRTFQQMSRNDFLALTNADRERLTFDTMTAAIRVLRALLRD